MTLHAGDRVRYLGHPGTVKAVATCNWFTTMIHVRLDSGEFVQDVPHCFEPVVERPAFRPQLAFRDGVDVRGEAMPSECTP